MPQEIETEFEDTLALGNPHPARYAPPPKAKLVCINAASFKGPVRQEIRLEGLEMTLGRSAENTVVLDLDGISRTHARLVAGDGKWGVQDLNSKNGVRVNKRPITKEWLEPGDIVSIGKVHFKYALQRHEPIETSEHRIDLRGTDATMVVDSDYAVAKAPAPPRRRRRRRTRDRGAGHRKSVSQRMTIWWWGAVAALVVLAVLGL